MVNLYYLAGSITIVIAFIIFTLIIRIRLFQTIRLFLFAILFFILLYASAVLFYYGSILKLIN